MKKLFTLVMLACGSLAAMATSYTDMLTVTLNGTAFPSTQSVISVEAEADGEYTLSLNNFVLMEGMPVGNIRIENVKGAVAGDATAFVSTQSINITPGDLPEYGAADWLGPKLGEVPIDLTAISKNDKLNANIGISMMGMEISVEFGSLPFQIGNSDFEAFHTATIEMAGNSASSDEPDHWHSFMSASSDNPVIAFLAGATPHTFISDVVRPGSAGAKSVLVTSADMGFTIANGTITTGRINAGSTTATETDKNYSWSDITTTDTDAAGDPFYAEMAGMPDSLTVWVKFKQKTPKADAPYATINAVLTDGTRYQDPENIEYTNIIAKATNAEIESKDYAWQRLSIPFAYSKDEQAKLIHVTISTNAQPGQGSTDSLFVDDLALVYNCKLTDLMVDGTTISGFESGKTAYSIESDKELTEADFTAAADGKGTIIAVAKNEAEEGTQAFTVYAIAGDASAKTAYTVDVKLNTTGINSVESTEEAGVKAVYTVSGQKVAAMEKGKVYIKQMTNGKNVKVVAE